MSAPISVDSSIEARNHNAFSLVEQARGELLLAVEFGRYEEKQTEAGNVKLNIALAEIDEEAAYGLEDTEETPVPWVASNHVVYAHAFPIDQQRMDKYHIDVETIPPITAPPIRLNIFSPMPAYDRLFINWLDFSELGVQNWTLAGNVAITAFVADLRAQAELDRNLLSLASLIMFASAHVKRTVT